jgi:tRNA threonylcarbamoyladenosine biosynthesis protein TsaE
MSNIVYSLRDISKASVFLREAANSKLLCFYGDLGTGKTTLIKTLVRDLGATEAGHSPTYGLVNEYYNSKGVLIAYHLDCYRLSGEEEALDMGIEEYLSANCYVFIEWPQRISGLLPSQRTEVYLEIEGPGQRKLTLTTLD